jgi:hypothetical protein
MMTDWYERTIKALQLNGKGERTHTEKPAVGTFVAWHCLSWNL